MLMAQYNELKILAIKFLSHLALANLMYSYASCRNIQSYVTQYVNYNMYLWHEHRKMISYQHIIITFPHF